MPPPKSCDTFAALPPGTKGNIIVFGKNSDRPSDEVQEVVYYPSVDYDAGSKVKCTYIEVDQTPHTYAVILSKPCWMWGAEMGANEHSVCVGNEAVWTKLNDDSDSEPKLLGMDLLRLALERARSAVEALNVIVGLIDLYGMGGNCSDTIPDFNYHNSFLIADPFEVWILECAGTVWAAEKVTSGVRNISNELSIGVKMDMKSENLDKFALDNGFWSSEKGPLNFRLAFGLVEDAEESFRYKCGKRLLAMYSKDGDFDETHMFKILRDKSSGICMSSGSFISTGSQVSVLCKPELGFPSCHWFTGTPDPQKSMFKPFFFVQSVEFPPEIFSEEKIVSEKGNWRHKLHWAHQKFCRELFKNSTWNNKIKDAESKYKDRAKAIASDFETKSSEAAIVFKEAVEEVLLIYNNKET